jgi:integrase
LGTTLENPFMARKVRDTNLETRTARLRLGARRKPYWRVLESGLHLGYRRLKEGSGSWVARRFVGDGRYLEARLSAADDFQDADGDAVQTFHEAQAAARKWNRLESRRARGLGTKDGPYTVEDACRDYLTDREAASMKSLYTARLAINAHIIPRLGTVALADLTRKQVRDWHLALTKAPRRIRTSRKAKAQAHRKINMSDPDAVRARMATANRVLNTLKAVLNLAHHHQYVADNEAWRAIKRHKGADSVRIRYLTVDEARRLTNACQRDLRAMVEGALLTGCRYSELARMRVHDFNPDAGTIHVRESKSGLARHVALNDEGRGLLASLVTGKAGNELIFLRFDGGPWKAAQQTRPLADACKQANITPPIGFHVLRHSYASALVMRGVPLAVVGEQLGHAKGSPVTARHYAHLSESYIADVVRAALPSFGIEVPQGAVSLRRPTANKATGKVVPMQRAK